MIITSIDKKLEKTIEMSLKRKQRADELRENIAKSNDSTSAVSNQEFELDFRFSNTFSASSTLNDNQGDNFIVVSPKKTQSSISASDVVPSTTVIFTEHITALLIVTK